MLSRCSHDLRIAARNLLRAPVVSLATVATLAVVCAGMLATWALVEAVFLRALPYAQADRLAAIWVDVSDIGDQIGVQDPRREWTSFDHYLDLRDGARSFDGIVAWRGWGATLSGEGEAERLVGAAATWNVFDVLGVSPALGRGFLPEDGAVDAPQVAVIGHGLWQRRFGGDPGVIGRVVEFNRMRYAIVGVMPAGFRFPGAPEAELFGAYQERIGDRGNANLRQFARLAPGVALQQAQQELDALAARVGEQHPDTHRGHGLFVEPLRVSLGHGVAAQLLVLQGAALMVLLIAAANLASLGVARAAGRRGEFALRGILGASRWRQLRLLGCEALLLASIGGLVGLALARGGLRVVTALFPREFAHAWDVQLGASAILLALVLSVLVALVITAAAATALRQSGLGDAHAQNGGRSVGRQGDQRLATTLVAGNFALALAVTVASVLLLDSHHRLQRVDLGYRPEGVVAGSLLLPSMVYPEDAELRSMQQRLREGMQAIPGVASVAFSTGFPLGQSFTDALVGIEGHATSRPDGRAHVWLNWVSHDFLDTLGIRVREGRGFLPSDATGGAVPVVVNAAFVRQHFGKASPLGRRLHVEDDPARPYTIVGVVEDIRYFGIEHEQTPTAYFSLEADPRRNLYLTVRSQGDVAAAMAQLRATVRGIDPTLALSDLRSVEDRVDAALAMPRTLGRITALFAVSGLLLAGIGVYGTLTHMVVRRTRELGVRRALGAHARNVLMLVLGRALVPAVSGIFIGLPLAWWVSQRLQGVLYGIGPAQLSAWLMALAVLMLVTFTAAALPALRAARIEPMAALRQE